MMNEILDINLKKSSPNIPWGFRIQGGKDFNKPLIVSRITCDSVADIQGLKCGDTIAEIAGNTTLFMTHQQAQQNILKSGINLVLRIERNTNNFTSDNSNRRLNRIDLRNHQLNRQSKARKGLSNDVHMTHSNYELKFKMPVCKACNIQIRGPFIIAMDFCFCPGHFICSSCGSDLTKTGFIEFDGNIFCEKDYREHLAPICPCCNIVIIGDEVIAQGHKWHPHCFICQRCQKGLGNGLFKMSDDSTNKPYCEPCWNLLFEIKCDKCGQPITIIDKFVEHNNCNYHAQCFNCTACRIPLAGKQFLTRNGKPFCKIHAFTGGMY